MSGLFIAATGTDIGKTFVTAGLVRQLRAKGIDALALKPVVSGYDPRAAAASDSGLLLSAMGRAVSKDEIEAISPWRFSAPLSPDMAARLEARELRLAEIADFCRARIASRAAPTLIEGSGGLMSPIAEDGTCIDLVRAIGCSAILVAGSYLGAISHALTAVEAMASRDIPLACVVVSQTPDSPVDLAQTCASMARFAPQARIVALPRGAAGDAAFASIAHACGLFS